MSMKRKNIWEPARKRLSLVLDYGLIFLCCEEEFPFEDLTLDHVVPVSAGGPGSLANLQLLCLPCNRRKGATKVDYRPEKRMTG